MKIEMTCMKCVFESGPLQANHFVEVLNDQRVYEFSCHRGHANRVIIQQPRYEILFELGINAILDGYYREAVSSITASAERSYELFSRMLYIYAGRTAEEFAAAWKPVSNHSERQLGFFISAWVLKFGELPELASQQMIAKRNSVIHKGEIPSLADVIKYSDQHLWQICSNLQKVKSVISEGDMSYDHEFFTKAFSNSSEAPNTTLSIPTIITSNLSRDDWSTSSTERYLESRRSWRNALALSRLFPAH